MKRKTDLTRPFAAVTFRCHPCRHTFRCGPARVLDAPEDVHHPWRYEADCPECGQAAPQASFERNLLKAWANATGPTTEEGKAAVTANLEGHPTPEEARRTRFNAMKHGLTARTATYFPAKPDGYSFCGSCEVDRAWCAAQTACVKKQELFLLHHAAFEQRDPKRLMGVYADLQAALYAVLQQVLQTIVSDGVKIETPQYYTDRDGRLIVADYLDEQGQRRTIMDIQAHPLFKPLGELLSRIGLTLADMGMTTKVIEDNDADMGKLASEQQSREAITEFQQRQMAMVTKLADAIDRGKRATNSDPVLLEHMQAEAQVVEVRP